MKTLLLLWGTFLLFSYGTSVSYGQCTESGTSNTGTNSTVNNPGQSFTASCGGRIDTIAITVGPGSGLSAGDSAVVKLYSGSTGCGTLLATSDSSALLSGLTSVDFGFATPVTVANNTAYHFTVYTRGGANPNSHLYIFGGSSTYSGGRALINCSNASNDFDRTFSVSIIAPLPVTLTSFQGKRAFNNQVLLEWETAMELDNSHFEVQRSENGEFFETVGWVEGNGNSSQIIKYDYIDDISALTSTKNVFYRLRQVDFDGSWDMSDVVKVDVLELSDNPRVIVSPNPSDGFVKVVSWNEDLASFDFILKNGVGQTVLKGHGNYNQSLDLTGLKPGLFYLTVTDDIQKNKPVLLVVE